MLDNLGGPNINTSVLRGEPFLVVLRGRRCDHKTTVRGRNVAAFQDGEREA